VRPASARTALFFGVFGSRSSTRARACSGFFSSRSQRDEGRQRLHQPIVERQRLVERRARAGLVALGEREHAGLRLHDPVLGRRLHEAPGDGRGTIEVPARDQAARQHQLGAKVARLERGGLLGKLDGRRQRVPLQRDPRELHLRGRGARV